MHGQNENNMDADNYICILKGARIETPLDLRLG